MVTACNRHGETMTTVMIYALWAVLCWLCYNIGWRSGVAAGTQASLKVLLDEKIIFINNSTHEISPGHGKTMNFQQLVDSADPIEK